MSKEEFRTIEDIFNDPSLDKILMLSEKKKHHVIVDPDVRSFQEIQDWVKNHGRLPKKVTELGERRIFSRLKGLQKKYDKLHPYDELGLLIAEDSSKYDDLKKEVQEDSEGKTFSSLEDVLNDDSILFSNVDKIKDEKSSFFDTKKVTKKQKFKPEKVAKRHKIQDFEEYNKLFKNIQADLASGRRQIRPFKNYDIQVHRFYLLNRQLIYIESIGDQIEKVNNYQGKHKDARVHVIYENGTEGRPLYLGLGASLYGRGGRVISEPMENFSLTNDDLFTGYIYILKSKSKDLQLTSIKSLYKVGFTTNDIQKRISNAENESTYLYAPVEVVEEIQVLNLSAEALETAIHHSLSPYQLDVDITGPNGKVIKPREWFVVSLGKIEDIVNEIVAKLQAVQ